MSGSKKLEKELQTKIKNRNLELEKLFKANETASAFNKFTNMYIITGLDMIDKKKFNCYKCFDGYSANWFFNNAEDNIIRVLRQNKPTKVKLVFHCKMDREMDGQLQIKEFGFSSAHELNLYGTDEKELYDKMIDKIIDEMDKVERAEGTGWNLHSITDLQLHTVEWVPQNGGSYIELDQYLKCKGAIINMKNKDNQCFKWCILRALNLFKNNNERIDENLKTKENTLNMEKIEYPVKLQDINRFESLNPKISITVYGYDDEKKKVYPLRVSEEFNRPNKINLLLIERDGNTHYCLIKNLSRLLSSQVSKHNGKTYICPRCINPFKSQESLDNHLEYCINTDCIKTVMPEKGKNDILKFINHHRSEKVPFIVYADIECLLKPIHSCQPDSKKSYTHKYQKHEPISFSYYIKCFDNNVYKPVLRSYTGKDAMEKFIEWLEEDIKYINDISSKPLIMEVEEEERFKNETKCWICKGKFNNDKDFKVRDHCHFTGRFRGAAHNSCNLKYKKPDFTPIVFHNLSGYDSHLFIRNLGNSEGDLDCIPNNDEKYISFSKRIEVGYYEKKVKNKKTGEVIKETKIKYHKMRLIDSNKFMNTSLDKLENNLPETAFNNLKRYYTEINLI